MSTLTEFIAESAALIEKTLDELIESACLEPEVLRDAIRWSLFGGGKRFRPVLTLAVGETFGVAKEKLRRTAAAVEMIHTYSLIHDDLPAMDDDDLRRGKPTCHKKFGEATAILAGDALQVLAFRAIADDTGISETVRVRLVAALATAAVRMVAGQQMDLDSEGKAVSDATVEFIHRNKTGALINFAATAAAIIAEAGTDEFQVIDRYAGQLGLMFQIGDDILDVTEPTSALGKTASKDVTAEKATYPSVYGLDGARDLLDGTYRRTVEGLNELDRPTDLLRAIADFVLNRRS